MPFGQGAGFGKKCETTGLFSLFSHGTPLALSAHLCFNLKALLLSDWVKPRSTATPCTSVVLVAIACITYMIFA